MSESYDEEVNQYFTEEQYKLIREFVRLRDKPNEFRELCKSTLIKLDIADLDYIIMDLLEEQMMIFFEEYRKIKPISLREYYIALRGDIWDYERSERAIWTTKFQKKYKYPLRLFYLLHKHLGYSYRDLEELSRIGKDTLNKYVKLYYKREEIRTQIRDLRDPINELERELRRKLYDIEDQI